jgi:hypothetical protein
LRKIHGISIKITNRQHVGDIYTVTAQARDREGREDEAMGAVALGKLAGDQLANALLKCETKAKRRVTLSICGLGMLDETETEAIPGARLHDSNAIEIKKENSGELTRLKSGIATAILALTDNGKDTESVRDIFKKLGIVSKQELRDCENLETLREWCQVLDI